MGRQACLDGICSLRGGEIAHSDCDTRRKRSVEKQADYLLQDVFILGRLVSMDTEGVLKGGKKEKSQKDRKKCRSVWTCSEPRNLRSFGSGSALSRLLSASGRAPQLPAPGSLPMGALHLCWVNGVWSLRAEGVSRNVVCEGAQEAEGERGRALMFNILGALPEGQWGPSVLTGCSLS